MRFEKMSSFDNVYMQVIFLTIKMHLWVHIGVICSCGCILRCKRLHRSCLKIAKVRKILKVGKILNCLKICNILNLGGPHVNVYILHPCKRLHKQKKEGAKPLPQPPFRPWPWLLSQPWSCPFQPLPSQPWP